MATDTPARSAPPVDPRPEWAGDDSDTSLFDHEQSNDGETTEEDAYIQAEVQGESDADEDDQSDELGDESRDDEAEDGDDLSLDGLTDRVCLPLDEATISEDDALTWVIDEAIVNNHSARVAQRRLIEQQHKLQDQLTPCQWAAVLAVDELAVARWADLAFVLVRWAWYEGRRVGREEE